MRRHIFTSLLMLLALQQAYATHISGGEVTYTYLGPGTAANTSQYRISLLLYKDCFSTSQVTLSSENIQIGIYRSNNLSLYTTLSLAYSQAPDLNNTPGANPCLSPPVTVCYQVGTYTGTISLPNTEAGYTLAWQRYTRVDLLNTTPANSLGATFLTKIPGTTVLPTGNNTCPQFVVKDTTVICKSTSFRLDFSASDADNDSLAYKFTAAYNGASGSATTPAPPPPATYTINPINYPLPYSGTSPLGPGVTIDVTTGLISGTAPATPGKYVICVMAEEWRNGELINTHRKDFIVNIANCGLNGAQLSPDVFTCDGFTWTFENQSTSSNINSYAWDFGDSTSSTDPRPTHTYKDSGTYVVKLKVTSSGGCQDSAKQNMRVYPGFFPDFTAVGSCKDAPFTFKDATRTNYGVVNSWRWNFGDGATLADTSRTQNPLWTYGVIDTFPVQLIVTNSKGCIDTATLNVSSLDRPYLQLPFRDTLICSIDTLQLFANSNAAAAGVFSWQPNYRISSTAVQNPLVNPLATTTYKVTLSEGGCTATDSITVNVLDFITVNAGNDTTICRTDSITLRPVSQALGYRWSPANTLNNARLKFPLATPTAPLTTYAVVANLGKCQAQDSVTIKTVPYPFASAGPDTTICFGDKATLNGTISGLSSVWLPSALVANPNALITVASPRTSTNFILVVSDTLGCPKPFRDTIRVTMLPQPYVFAGNDTSIIVGQPLLMQAVASSFLTTYQWTAATGLSSDTVLRPTALISSGLIPPGGQLVYTFSATSPQGCTASDEVVVKIYKTPPSIFVPNAFTPNGDGNNDIFKPIMAGMQRLDYFRVYNRYGQLMYSTSALGQGWNGKTNGEPQGSAGYVYTVQAMDYLGQVVKQSGSFLLVR